MNHELSRTNGGAIAIGEQYGFDASKVALVKEWVAKGTTDDELALFLYTAQRTGLDPLAKQIYCIKRYNSSLKKEVATPQTSIDGYRLIADRTGNYAPGREPAFEYTEAGQLHSATAYVMKYARGTWLEVAATAHWKEYAQSKRDGGYTQMWETKPHIMLAKCAEALALRRAFPAELSGIYTDSEMGDEAPQHVNTITGEVIEDTTQPPVPPADPERDALVKRFKTARAGLKQMGQILPAFKVHEFEAWSHDKLLSETEIAEREYDSLRTPAAVEA